MSRKNLDYISITDHNTALAYEELENKKYKNNFYSGKNNSRNRIKTQKY